MQKELRRYQNLKKFTKIYIYKKKYETTSYKNNTSVCIFLAESVLHLRVSDKYLEKIRTKFFV